MTNVQRSIFCNSSAKYDCLYRTFGTVVKNPLKKHVSIHGYQKNAFKTSNGVSELTLCRHYTTSSEAEITLENIFSDENKSRSKKKLSSISPHAKVSEIAKKKKKNDHRKASVLVPLCMVHGEPSVLFTLRSSLLVNHRGQVSFPGGMQDETDKDMCHTALRETEEELGISMDRADIWGELPGLPNRRDGNIWVTPVIANIGDVDLNNLHTNPAEVEEVFHSPIASLVHSENNAYTRFITGKGYTLPVFLGANHRIWGLTAIILHQTLTIIAPGLYTFKIRHR